jgi:amphi-Trp domain-containing protein
VARKRDKQQAKAAKRAEKAQRRRHRRKAQGVLSRAEIAEQLRSLASQVETGIFRLGDLEMELPPHADFEVGYKLRKRGGHQIEVEIEWGALTHTSLLPSE